MTADFRALCVELTDCLEKADWPLRHRYVFRQWIDIARAALADEPAVSEGREPAAVTGQPSDGELWELYQGPGTFSPIEYARDLLGRRGNPTPQPPADGEVAELVTELQSMATDADKRCRFSNAERLSRAAELLEQQAPVAVSERPWEREGWCDTDGLCWLGSDALDGCTPTWLYGPPAWAERFPNVHRVLLPAHALLLPEVGE